MVRALAAEGRRYKSFKGISFQLYRDGAAWWGDIQNGCNDYIIEAFERDTGIRVPGDRSDPLRGKAYYEWIRANAYDRCIRDGHEITKNLISCPFRIDFWANDMI